MLIRAVHVDRYFIYYFFAQTTFNIRWLNKIILERLWYFSFLAAIGAPEHGSVWMTKNSVEWFWDLINIIEAQVIYLISIY